MNKQSSFVGRYHDLRTFLIHFEEVPISQQKTSHGDFIRYQRNMIAKTIQHSVHLSDHSKATHANWIDGQSKYISEANGTRACWTYVEHYCTLLR